ncbi:MAG: aminotransferase class V-fold PLP-dependent enzyme [Phenylobacterium sp.]|uniref:aminotransferase class V-fold PLP-dependent enzyme n=1 Tax=Phenylobacterium sp. TaxID=1871053 RepID=UPI001A3CAF4C|nr:aminotransferase class V-fold PLP-dependent enzyme [Phenylobacterium sp.]MBL8770445.1 aminotransferase class V-fold PLP-dependent enzyme [Phenylobacterium sp.]
MKFTRRALVAAAAATPGLAAAAPPAALPARSAFAKMPYVYLDSGSTHPMPLGARAALEEYLRFKTRDGPWTGYSMGAKETAVLAGFGALVGAAPDELVQIQSTTMGENLVLAALGFPQAGGRIVTDALHFFGSFYTYGELAKAGVDVVTLPMTPEGRIDMAAMAAAVNDGTQLVSVSHVSTTNGFEHDLKAVCDLAHAHGAYVYADIVHGAGSTPLDLRAAGVDFAACSSYKWLMGDFGLAFLYVRREIQEKVARPWWGYHQVGGRFVTHVFPFDPPGDRVSDYSYAEGASGKFAMGTTSWTGVVQLEHSLAWIRQLGVANIQAYRQPMADAIQAELRRRGYQPMTPLDSRTPLVAFALKDARAKLAERLQKNDIRMTVSANRFRVSLSVFNDMNDVDRLLAVLPKAPPA